MTTFIKRLFLNFRLRMGADPEEICPNIVKDEILVSSVSFQGYACSSFIIEKLDTKELIRDTLKWVGTKNAR